MASYHNLKFGCCHCIVLHVSINLIYSIWLLVFAAYNSSPNRGYCLDISRDAESCSLRLVFIITGDIFTGTKAVTIY